jgi:hypothetical protein
MTTPDAPPTTTPDLASATLEELARELARRQGTNPGVSRDALEMLSNPRSPGLPPPVSSILDQDGPINAADHVATLLPPLIMIVAELASRAMKMPRDQALFALGMDDETSDLCAHIAARSPRRPPREVIKSRTVGTW